MFGVSSWCPYDDVNQVLDALAFQMRLMLSEKLVGLYLFGSLASGDFEPYSSDLDLLAATSADLTDGDGEALRRMHQQIGKAYPDWDDRIDVAYLSVEGLLTFRSRQSPIGIISPGEPLHMETAGTDWLVNWYSVREHGISVLGPSPKEVIEPISKEELIEAIRDYGSWLCEQVNQGTRGRERKAQAYAILSMCRALYACRVCETASKRRAAMWAQKELPVWSELIEIALEWRRDWRNANVDHAATHAETVRFVNLVSECLKDGRP